MQIPDLKAIDFSWLDSNQKQEISIFKNPMIFMPGQSTSKHANPIQFAVARYIFKHKNATRLHCKRFKTLSIYNIAVRIQAIENTFFKI